ncbi:MAG: AmmeMemoRadiSam system radical SAM enzyme [Candidatus Syntrophosphaera sp.]
MAETITREAMFYEKLEDQKVRCQLCPHSCVLKSGQRGICRGRKNVDGKMIAVNYGQSVGLSVDPIEKKPLYHYRPRSTIISVGPNSCNFSCFFCQNYDISQLDCPTRYITIEQLYSLVGEYCKDGPRQIAFTYTEPFMWYEFIHDFANFANDTDIIMITNGYISPDPLKKLMPRISAMNIDLKAIRDDFYRKYAGGTLEPVKQTIIAAHESKVHIELTNLLIPGLNDSEEDIDDLIDFVASIDVNIPLHFSAYYPAYKATIPATSPLSVLNACKIASEKLSYVYGGNIYTESFQETTCPKCGATLITAGRKMTGISETGTCKNCGHRIYGVF